jgi:hypothetical protein
MMASWQVGPSLFTKSVIPGEGKDLREFVCVGGLNIKLIRTKGE